MSREFVDEDYSANVSESSGQPASGNPGLSHGLSHVSQGHYPNTPSTAPAGSSGTEDAPPQYDQLYPSNNSNSGHSSQNPQTGYGSHPGNSGRVSPNPGQPKRGENAYYHNQTGATGGPIPGEYPHQSPPPPAQQQQHYSPTNPPTQQHNAMHNQPFSTRPQQGYQSYPPPSMPPPQDEAVRN